MKISDFTSEERPRERLLGRGAQSLSDGELLAIVIRAGTRTENALDLSRRLLAMAGGSLSALAALSIEKLTAVPGIGPMKAAGIAASLELGRRLVAEKPARGSTVINSPEQIFRLMLPRLKGLQHEECWALFLDNAHHLLATRRMSSGGQDSTSFDVRPIIRAAVDIAASGIVLVHNHPSGNPHPGTADIQMTERLHNALNMCELDLVDHIVISDGCFYSFADEQVTYA